LTKQFDTIFNFPAMGANSHPPIAWLEFSAIDPGMAKARQRFKLCGWNRFQHTRFKNNP